jgi:hypothetical protein
MITTDLQNIEGRDDNFDDSQGYYRDLVKWAAENPGKMIGLSADTYDHAEHDHFAMPTTEAAPIHFAPVVEAGPKTTRRDVVWGMRIPLRPDFEPVWHFARLGWEKLPEDTYRGVMAHIQETDGHVIEMPAQRMEAIHDFHIPA